MEERDDRGRDADPLGGMDEAGQPRIVAASGEPRDIETGLLGVVRKGAELRESRADELDADAHLAPRRAVAPGLRPAGEGADRSR